jgi:hypothetical protein
MGEMELVLGAVRYKIGTLRSLSLFLAVFILTAITLAHLIHSKADFQPIACESASCASSEAQNRGSAQLCLGCIIVRAFQTAQVILFLLLLHITTLLSGFCRPNKSQLHPVPLFSYQWVRGPPVFAQTS